MNYLKLKKILAIVCVVCQISLLFSFNFSVSADTDYADVISKLTNFGVFIADDQMDRSDEEITREELSLILADFCGIDRTKSYPATGVYSDIETSNASAGIMELMGTSGIIASYSDGLFRPSNPATFGVVVKALINISGYTPIANLKGGWPNGYIEQAEDLGITDGIYKQYNDSITKGEFAQLLFNFLPVDLMRTSSVSGAAANKYEVLEGRTVASEKLNLFDAEGVLSATDVTSLTGEEYAGPDRVVINGVAYDTDKDLSDFLGMYVKFYYIQGEDDDYGKIVDIEAVDKKNNVLIVNDEDISVATTVTELVYTTGKKTKTADIALDATMIFNGVRKPLFNARDLKPENGSIKLIDSNNDNLYDVIVATHYIDYVVSLAFMDNENLVISDKLGKPSVSIDITDKTVISIFKDGVKDSLASASENAVLSVAADQMDLVAKTIGADSTKVTIQISNNVASGKIAGLTGQASVMNEGVLSHYSYETITVGDTEYYFSPDYNFLNNKPVLGNETNALLNYKGQVASLTKETEYQYGVIVGAAAEGGLDAELKVKMFNANGKIVTMNCITPLVIDGKRYTDAQRMEDRLKLAATQFSSDTRVYFDNGNGTAQLVKYKVDLDKNILEIDTCLRGENELDSSLAWSKNVAQGGHKFGGAGTFTSTDDGEKAIYAYDETTIFFKVPSDLTNDIAFDIMTKSEWGGDSQNYDLKIYDMDDCNFVPVAFIQSDVAGASEVDHNEATNMAIVTEVYTGLNKDGETVTLVSALLLKTGAKVELQVPADVMRDKTVYRGSIVRWEGTETAPSAFEVTASVVDGVLSGEKITATAPSTSFYAGFRATYGTVVELSDNMMLLRVDYTTSTGAPAPAVQATPMSSITRVYDFDTDSSNDRSVVAPVAKTSLKAEKDFGPDASKVLLIYDYGKPIVAVIYR